MSRVFALLQGECDFACVMQLTLNLTGEIEETYDYDGEAGKSVNFPVHKRARGLIELPVLPTQFCKE